MRKKKEHMEVSVDTYTRVCLTVIAVLLSILILGLWAEGTPSSNGALAAEPFLNTSAQRDMLIKAQDRTTQKLEELISLLQSGQVKVVIAQDSTLRGGKKDVPPQKPK